MRRHYIKNPQHLKNRKTLSANMVDYYSLEAFKLKLNLFKRHII